VDDLARAKQAWWQMLPLPPPGAGNSPYQAYSAFAGNPLLVSPDDLVAVGQLREANLGGAGAPASFNCNHLATRGPLGPWRSALGCFPIAGAGPLVLAMWWQGTAGAPAPPGCISPQKYPCRSPADREDPLTEDLSRWAAGRAAAARSPRPTAVTRKGWCREALVP
jgi:4-alpha-glucanotransferase